MSTNMLHTTSTIENRRPIRRRQSPSARNDVPVPGISSSPNSKRTRRHRKQTTRYCTGEDSPSITAAGSPSTPKRDASELAQSMIAAVEAANAMDKAMSSQAKSKKNASVEKKKKSGLKKAASPKTQYRKPKKKKNRICSFCSTTVTPMWRRGPDGKGTLCNACGVRWGVLRRKHGGKEGALLRKRRAPKTGNTNTQTAAGDGRKVKSRVCGPSAPALGKSGVHMIKPTTAPSVHPADSTHHTLTRRRDPAVVGFGDPDLDDAVPKYCAADLNVLRKQLTVLKAQLRARERQDRQLVKKVRDQMVTQLASSRHLVDRHRAELRNSPANLLATAATSTPDDDLRQNWKDALRRVWGETEEEKQTAMMGLLERAFMEGVSRHASKATNHTDGTLAEISSFLLGAEKRLRTEVGLELSKVEYDFAVAEQIANHTDRAMTNL